MRKMLMRKPKCRGAIWARELLTLADEFAFELVDIHHYRPGLSINSAACFRIKS